MACEPQIRSQGQSREVTTGRYNEVLIASMERFMAQEVFYDPNTLTRDNQYISPYADSAYQPKEFTTTTDAINDHAVQFVTDHAKSNAEQPFFLYMAHTAAHWPMHAKESDIAK